MPEMESLVAHNYNGRDLTKGELFEAEEKYIPFLIALKRARRVEADQQDEITQIPHPLPAETVRHFTGRARQIRKRQVQS